MSRSILALSPAQLTSFDLETFMTHAKALNQQHLEACPTPFPKAPSRWLSHYQFTSRPLALTREGDVDGGSVGSSAPRLISALPARSVPPTTVPEAAHATTRPASSC